MSVLPDLSHFKALHARKARLGLSNQGRRSKKGLSAESLAKRKTKARKQAY
jgi:hypothetical protein